MMRRNLTLGTLLAALSMAAAVASILLSGCAAVQQALII
jgi:hypothetical protein